MLLLLLLTVCESQCTSKKHLETNFTNKIKAIWGKGVLNGKCSVRDPRKTSEAIVFHKIVFVKRKMERYRF